MGTFVNLVAKPGTEAQINAAYAAMTGNPEDILVYSDEVIRGMIAHIQSPKCDASQRHLRTLLKTVENWNSLFWNMRSASGQIQVWSVPDSEKESRRKDLRFVLEHRLLFESIYGLDEARRLGFTDAEFDLIEDGLAQMKRPAKAPGFEGLPRGTSKLYGNCVEYKRADVWEAYLAYKDHQTEENWLAMRTLSLPWRNLRTIWQLCERYASDQDGVDSSLEGRYRDGKIPPFFLLALALKG